MRDQTILEALADLPEALPLSARGFVLKGIIPLLR
jgi:hypothetical protein